jgi:hypothetical protein
VRRSRADWTFMQSRSHQDAGEMPAQEVELIVEEASILCLRMCIHIQRAFHSFD